MPPPGTPEYRSPEAIRFLRGQTEEDTFTYGLSDELWALGVMLYWLLTRVLPFGGRNEPGLNQRILTESPRPPHVVNPRVPEAVSRLCMRMLEKDPRERFQTYDELCTAAEALLSGSEVDATWDLPLGAPEPRGMPPAPPVPDEPPPPAGGLEGQARAPSDAPAGPVAGDAAPLVREQAEARAVALDGLSGLRRGWVGTGGPLPWGPLLLSLLLRPPLALVVALAVVALAAGAVGSWRWPAPAREATPAPVEKKAEPPPDTSAPVREMARPGAPSDADRDAAPVRAQPPAPTPTVMARKEDSRSKPEEKPAPQQRGKTSRCIPIPQRVCTAAGVCSILLTGCPGAQVRPEPAPIECPAGWRETHAKFRIRGRGDAVLQGYRGENTERATVREGPVTVITEDVGKLPQGTLLHGTLQLGENRFYSTFTQAQLPGGEAYPVCLVIGMDTLSDNPGGPDCPEGLGDCPAHESRPGNVKIFTRFEIHSKDAVL